MGTLHLRLLQLTLFLTFLLLLLGGLVHNTGSSLACPDWPLCYGQFFPKMEGGILIEHSHRLLASTVGLLTILNLIFTVRRKLGAKNVRMAAFILFLVICQGLLGGITVIYKLPTIVSTLHLALSNIFFCSLIYFLLQQTKAAYVSKVKIQDEKKWDPTLKNWAFFSLILIYGQMILGAFIRHSSIGTVCGVGLQNALACFDQNLGVSTFWPSNMALQTHYIHRLFALVVFLVVMTTQGKLFFFAKKNGRLILPPFGTFSFFPILVTLIQIFLGVMTVATGLGVSFTTLHLGFAALLLASMYYNYIRLVHWEEKLFGKKVPTTISDYFELTKPKLSLLVIVSASIGLLLSPGHIHFFSALFTVLFSALLIAGASTLNCYIEHDVDKMMERTKDRPLPAGRMQRKNALVFGLLLIVISLPALAWFSNLLTAGLGALATVLYLAAYTPLKKKTTLALFIGAIPGATPIVMGQVAATDRLDWMSLALFLILFVWQLPHFLAISLYCQKDYERAQIKILPSIRGVSHTKIKIFLYTILLIVVSLLPVWIHFRGSSYQGVSIALGLGFLLISFLGFFQSNKKEESIRWAKQYFYGSLFYLPLLLTSLLFFK